MYIAKLLINICLPYFAGTELDNQKARTEFTYENNTYNRIKFKI